MGREKLGVPCMAIDRLRRFSGNSFLLQNVVLLKLHSYGKGRLSKVCRWSDAVSEALRTTDRDSPISETCRMQRCVDSGVIVR